MKKETNFQKLEKINKDFFYSNAVVFNPSESHGYYENSVQLGISITVSDLKELKNLENIDEELTSNSLENILHEIGHLIEENLSSCFSETNWGFGGRTSDDIEILKKVIQKEARIMNYTYRLLDYYEIEEWELPYWEYADSLSRGLIQTLNDFFSKDSITELEDTTEMDISTYIYNSILKDLENYSPKFEEIKNMWDNKVNLIEKHIQI